MNGQLFRSELQKTANYLLRPVQIIRSFELNNLRPDLVAGLTVGVLLLPQAMAYALLAGLPPQTGLYTGIIAAIFGSLWGSSNHLHTGPTNADSLLALSVLTAVVSPEEPGYIIAAGILALLVGIFRLLMGLARLGLLVNFISDSVVLGFSAGAGMLILFNQMRNLLRLNFPSHAGLISTMQQLIANISDSHFPSLILGSLTIAAIFILKKINRKLPGALVAIVAAAAAVALVGAERLGVRTIGEIPRGFPPISSLPVFDLQLIGKLSTGALAISAIGLVEAISISRTIAAQTGQRLDSNQELVGQGLANIACAFFSGYNCSGSFTRSAVSHQAGGRSPIAGVFSGLFVLVIVLLFGPLASAIPLAALAGVVVVVALSLINIPHMKQVWDGTMGDRVIMLFTLVATLLLPLEFAVLFGILLSLGNYLMQTSTPQVDMVRPDPSFKFFTKDPGLPDCPQLAIVEVMGDLYFGAAHHVEECIYTCLEEHPDQRYLLMRMHSVDHCDISGIHVLEGIVRMYRERGGDVFITRYQNPVLAVMENSGFMDFLGAENFLERDQNAIGQLFYHALDPVVCVYECPYKVFLECQNLPKRLDLVGDLQTSLEPGTSVDTIEAKTLWDELRGDHPPEIIDVREHREFVQGHIPGARMISLPSLLNEPQQLPDDEKIVLVCRGGRRSTRAANMLSSQGREGIRVLKGGLLTWEAAHLLLAVDEGNSYG